MAISITGFSADRITTTVGQTVKFTAAFDGNVSLIRTASQTPFLALSNGGLAYFDSVATGNATDQLVFSYTVANSDNTMSNLQVNGLFLDGASLVDASSQTVDTTVTRGDNSQIVLTGTSDSVSIIGQSIVSNDLIAPKVSSVEAVTGNYKVGDKVTVSVVFDEAVGVTPGAQLPTLSFTSNGEVLTDVIGSYVSGSGTKKLNFTFTVTETMDIADLEVGALNVNGSVLADASGNVVSNNNGSIALPVLPSTVAISLGDQSETVVTTPVSQAAISIESIRYLSDDTDAFKVGDVLDFSVRMTGVTTVDTSEGVPTLVLGNGGLATYVSGSGSNTLTFRYIVSSQDRNTTDLKVLGVAENDGLFLGSAGQLADVRISATNNLSLFNDVKINAQSPYITRIDSTSDTLGLGDSVEFMVNFSEAVELSGDAPTLTLSNGATATYVSGSTSNVLLFRYTASEGDADSSDLDVTGFDAPNSTLMSLAGHGEASLSLAKAASVASKYAIEVDSTRPEGVITFESTQLTAGESTGVTITFTESVSNPHAAITVSNGTLSALVAVEGTASERTVWKGTFTPAAGIESSDTTLVLDNSLVKDDAGNTGNGISVSAPLSIDTLGPVVSMSNEVLFNGNRLITIDLGETVTDFSVDDIVVSNGIKVTSGFSEVEANRIYTLEVSPSGNGAVGDLKVTLRKGSVSDALGNVNAEQSFTTGWDIKAPEIESISATNGTFTVGDTLSIAVRYDEVVNVDTTKGVPFLALNNGAKAEYVRGSESDTLVFEYVIQAGDYADHLDVMAMVKDSGVIEDNSGNAARTMISAGMNLGDMSSVEIDGVAPSIVTMTAESGLYLAGDTATITVQFSEAITVDESQGSPILALSNGSIAQYTGGSGSHYLTFTYEVQANDFDTTDLDVHALIENGSTLQDAAGNDANLVLQSALNHLSYRSDVVVDAATPYINTISANAGYYKAGDTIDIALGWNKPVVMDDALGTPEIKLSNGAVVALNSAMSSVNKLVFSYTLTENDIETTANAPLSVAEFRPNYATFKGVVAGVPAANLSGLDAVEAVDLPNLGAIAQDQGGIQIDMSGPSVASLTVLGADDGLASFKAGEAATVTLTFSEAVKEVLPAYFAIENGKLGAFSTDDNITWTATFVPTRDTDAGEQSLSLDLSKIADMAGNYGAGQSVAASYTLDSEYPTVTLRSDVVGVTNEEVRIVVNFSETVENFDLTKISVLNGTVDANSLETPDNSGRPEGEYSFIVIPDANSTQPIKVRVMDGVVTDLAGNANKQSEVLVQPVDTVKAKIESIQTEAGAYAVGDTVRLEVNFSEAVELHDDPTDPTSDRVPTLFLNNGELATYVSGSGSDTWVFEYTYAADDATSSRPLQVLSFLENDKLVLDTAGNRTHTVLNSSNRLKETVIVDGEGPVVAGFSAIEASYNSSEASESGVYNIGDVVWIKLNTSEWVSVDSAAGRPTLELANGGSASYVSGSGSDTLLFRYVVQDADASTDALEVSSIAMNGGSIVDVAGNALNVADLGLTTVAGLTKSTQAVVIDADAPIVELVTLVEDAGENTDVTNDGYYKAGTTLAFDVSFDDALIVDTTDGAPVLTLSNGQLAEYVLDKSDLANGVMRFEYTVLADDINTTDLKVLGLAEQGAVITDDAGNAALVEMVTDRRNYTTAVIDTKAPESVGTVDSFTENADGEDIVRTLETLTYTFEFNEMMDLVLATVPGVDSSIDPTDTATIEQIVIDNQDEFLSYFNVTLSAVDADVHVRVDGDGDLLADVNAGLVANNFRFETNDDGTLDLTRFSVDVTTPDRTYADLNVGLNTAKFVDFAQNAPTDLSVVHTQRVDTQSFDLTAIPTAGLFITDTSTVRVLDANGDELVASILLNPETGQASVRVSPNEAYPGGYRGPVLVEVIDSDASPDYIDEFTGQGVSLAAEGETAVMRAMFNIVEPGEVTVTVSPVTELAVTKLQETMSAEGVTSFDSAKVDEYNAGVGRIFGIKDIVKTAATVVNSATVEAQTGADVADFNAADGIDASEKYGQVLAMLSARDSATGSLSNTISDLAADIKVASLGTSTAIAITQRGADKLAGTLKTIETAAIIADPSTSDQSVALNNSGVNTGLIDVSYIEAAAGTSYGINLAEARETRVPVKGAVEGDTVFVQWGINTATGQPNLIEYVVTAADVAVDGSVTVPVSIDAIALQMDSKEVPIRTAVIKPDAVDAEGNPVAEPNESDFTAPVLLQVDIIPPETTVEAPTADTPFVVGGAIQGLNAGDDFFILINNSTDERFKYKVESTFLGDPDAELPAGLSLNNVVYDEIGDTWAFDWRFDLTQAVSVAELAAAEADPTYTPVPTFSADSDAAVFQVDAATSDIVGNAAEDNSRNEFIIGTASDIVDSEEEQGFMDEVLNRLSDRYGDAPVDTRAEIQMIANAVNNLDALAAFDSVALDGALVAEQQTLTLSSDGAVDAAIFTLDIGGDALTVDLEGIATPTVADIVDEIKAASGYADKNYTVSISGDGNSVEISYKAFGPQPESSANAVLTQSVSADQIGSTVATAGDITNFEVQTLTLEGVAVESVFAVSPGQIRLSFGGVDLDVTANEGDLISDILADLKADADYAGLPFKLTLNETGDALVATWKQVGTVSDIITLNRDYTQVTETRIEASSSDGDAGISTQELQALDVQNVDDSKLGAINKALAENLTSIKSDPSISFADATLAAGDSTTVTLTFPTRVGQVPDDVLALVGGDLSTEGSAGEPIWSSTDGINWTASFTATSQINNTALRYEPVLDEDGAAVLDTNGDPKLAAIPILDADANPTGAYEFVGLADLRQVSLVEALVNRVTDASDTVKAFAAEQGDTPAALPTVQDFADMTIEGVRNDNLSAVQDALASVRDRFEGEGDLFTQIETVIDSYNAVFNTVYASGDQPTSTDLIEDLTNLGVSNLATDAARAAEQTMLLQGALQAVAAAKVDVTNEDGSTTTATEQQAEMINSVAKLESFVASAERVLARANGETISGGTPVPVSAMTLEVVHATSDYYPDGYNSSLYINAGEYISVTLETAGGSVTATGTAASRDDLQSVVDGLNADLAGTGYTVSVAAGELTFIRTDEAPFTLALERPSSNPIYGRLINTETGDDLYPGDEGTFSSSPDTLGASGAPVQVSDTDLAALGFEGLLADTAGNSRLTSLQKVIADQAVGDGSAAVTDYADLKTLLDNASNAFDSIVGLTAAAQDTTYTDDAARSAAVSLALAALDADSFKTMGVDGVTDVAIGSLTAAAMSDAVKDALTNTDASITSFEAIQAIVDDYTQVLSVASGDVTGTGAVISDAQFTNLGVALSSDDAQEPSALAALLSGVIAHKASPAGGNATDNVDSISELQALADAAKKVFDSAALTVDPAAENAGVLATQTDLNTLGFDTVDADNLDAIQRVLVRNAADRDAVKDYADLKSLIDAAVDAHTALTDVVATAQGGSAPDLSGLDETDFAAMGLDNVDSDTVAAVLDALTRTANTVVTAGDIQTIVDSYNTIFDVAEIDTGSFTQADLANIGITLSDGLSDNDASLASGVIAELSFTEVNTVDKVQGIVDAIDAVFANAARTSDDDTTNTVTVTKDQLLTLGFDGVVAEEVTDENLDAIQRVLTDLADEDGIADYANLRTLIEDAIIAHQDILDAAGDDATGVTTDTYGEMGIDGVDASNLASINDALENTPNTLTTAASIQEMVDSYNHILDLRSGTTLALDAADFTDLGVTLKAAGTEQNKQLAYLQEIVESNLGSGDITTVAGLQDLADATSDLIDMIQGVSPDSDGVTGLTPDQFALLGINDGNDPAGPITAAQADMLSKRLALTADDLSEVTDLATDLKGLWDAATASMAKIKAYAESDATADFDTSGSFDSGDVPTVDDFKNIGVVEYAVTEVIGGSGWNISTGIDADGDLAARLEGGSSSSFFYDEDNNLIKSSGALRKIQIIEETSDHIEFYVYGELTANINATTTAAPNGPYYGWQHLRFERDANGDVTRTIPPTSGVDGSLTTYSFLDDPAYVGITSDLSALGVQDTSITMGSEAFYGLKTGAITYQADDTELFVEPTVQTTIIAIDTSNIASIDELFAATSVGADAGDLPATSAVEVQTVIDQGASRLHAITKIANYAENNGVDTTTYPAPDAADFAAAGVTGVTDDNNVAGLLATLRGTTPATNFAAADTAAELQAYVKQVAINKIAKWADTDGDTVADGTGVNAVEPILQDYLNAGLVDPNDQVITAAMVPALNELFASSAVSADAADTDTLQQGIIDGAAAQLAAMARIADYAEANGAIDLDNDANTGDENGYDQLTVADFEAIGVFGVGDGTGVSTGSGIDSSNTSYNNLTAVLNKLADAGITYVSADTAEEVQDLVAQVAVEKIARYADEDGQLPLVSETIDVTTYDDGAGNAFYLDGEQAPALTLQPGTYTFTQTEASNTGHALAFFLNSDRTGDVTSQGITVSSTGVAGSNGVTTLVIPEGFDGTLYYECANHSGMGNAVDVAVPYFEPELQDYTNAGLQDPNDNAINANQVAAINEAFADSDVGNASNEGDTYTADDVAGQQAVIDAFGDRILALEKFADYMLGTVPANDTDVLTAADFAVADFTDAGLARVDGTNMSAVLARLDDYQSSDSLTRDDLLTTANIQSYVSRAIIAEYNATSGTSQAPVAQDYIDADITGADADNVLAMNYQVKTAATFSDTVAYLDTTLVPAADATLNKLDVFDLSHVAPVSTSTRLSVSDTTAAVTLTTADFGTFADANGDSLATVKITAVPASGRLLLADAATLTVTQTTAGADAAGGSAAVAEVQTIDASSLTAHAVYELQIGADTVSVTVDGDPTAAELAALLESALNAASIPVTAAVSSNDITLTWDTAGVVSDAVTFARQAVVVQVDESITAADIAAGKLQLAPVDAATPLKTTSIGFEVSDGTNTSANNYTLAVDVSEVVNNGGFADSLVTQADEDTWTNLYDINALSDFVVPSAGIDTLRVVVEATNGHVRLGSVPTGVTEITTGFAADATAATNTAIAFEGSQDAVNAALRQLQGNLGTNPDMTLNINVQPGGVVHDPETGHYYQVIDGNLSWTDAKAAAETKTFAGLQGYLMNITSAEENALIQEKVAADSWVGGTDEATEGTWVWAGGPEAGQVYYQNNAAANGAYVGWKPNEPNNGGAGEDYMQIFAGNPGWNDRSNGPHTSTSTWPWGVESYVVEYGGMTGDNFVGVTANKSITLMNASVVASQDAAAQSMMLQDYLEAGVEGVTADNLAAVNYAVEQAADGAAGTNPDLASLVAQANAAISALTNATDANALTVDQFAAAGVKGVTVENLAIASASVVAASADDKDSVPDLQTIAEKASALSIIKGYSEGVSGAAVPTAVDYAAAGITHYDSAGTATTISARNIEAINQVMQVSYTDGFTVTDSSSVQAILDSDTAGATSGVKYVSRLGAIEKIAHYASGTETANAPTAADYDAAGIAGVYDSSNNGAVAGTPNNIQAVNMAVRADLAGYMDANTTAEIQVAVSRGRITHYANTNGLDDQATPAPLAAALVPTVADYANVGVTEIYDGSSLVAIDGSNVEQVNDLMAMRYVGDPDTNGDATVDGSDNGRIDVINNATDAATNETNLNYAGTVNTVAEIQNAVAKAMGDKADADDATFGLRVEALDKINAFITAIDGLADKAAYDTYIADSANASAIPTAADYNAAGVLDLSESTDGISSALVSAINYKLFEGGADTAVNTASELQSYVDSANEIVNKIQNWAEPDWSGIGTSASYISLVPKFANANFEEGSGGNIPGWVTYNDWVDLGVTQLAGYTSPQDPVAGPLNTPDKGGQAQEVAEDWTGGITSRSISVTLEENYDAQHGSVVVLDTGELSGTAGNRWNTGTANNIFHGPAIWSEGTVKLKAGASVAIDFRAINAGDAADVYGYLLNVDTGQHIDLLDFNPYVDGENQDWQTASVTLTAGQDGEYRFVFVGGSNNGDNGGTSGGKFIIDNILVDSPPEKFNGVVSTNNEADYVNVQSVFDGEGYVDSNSLAFTSDTPAAPGSTVELGWYDQGDFGFDPAVADTLIIHPNNTGTDFSKLPVDFDVMGWDNDTAQWELIKSFAPSENVQATTTTTGSSGSAYEVQTIASPTINNSGYYTLEIGSNRVVVQLDGDATVSELATALDSALTTAGVGVTVAASGSDLTLAWDTQVEVTDVANLTAQSIVETSDGKALEYDLSDATKAYTGFKIVVRDTLGGDGTVEITELDFQARSLTAADLPSDSEPTWQEYSQIGVVGVTENNLSDINAMVFAQSSKSDVATIPMIQAIVDNYIASMSIIEAFTNGDGAADTNGNFTYDSGETGVPTVADYQNIGVRYVVNGDGLNVPISNANIPAINEVLAQAAYGVDSGDTAISNATELRGVLNSDAVAARLTAINKIASIAQATASELALTAANLADGDAVYLQLTANGVTEEVSATLTSDTASAASLASALNGSLGSDSAFTISENAGDIVITRNDGAAFTVVESAANTSAGTWTLTDTASNVLSASNTSSLAVAATSDLPTIADFTAAGITGVNSETYQPTINDLVAQSAYSNIDTLKEIQEVVDNKTAIFELLTFIDDGELYSEVSDTYNYGLANFDPEETVSSGYYLFDEGASGTWPRILGAEDAFDGTTSTTDNGWWVSEREDVGTGQVDHYGIFGRANYQAYLGYFDRDNSEGPTLVQSVSFANSSVVSHYRGRLQGYDEAKGVWSTIKSFDTGNIESNATYTINVASDYGSSLEKKAYDGYRLVFDETVEGGWTGPRIDVTELYINTKKVLPLATPETFTTAGITGVTDDNIDQIRKVVLESTTADSSIDDVRSVVDGVVVGLQSLQTALASGSLDTITAQTYADVGIDGVADDNIDAINAIAASRQASLNSGETLSISDLQRIADDVTTNFSALLKLAELMGQQSTDNDKLSLAQTLLTADRSYVPDLDAVNATDAQVAINNLLGFTSDSPVSDLEGLGVVAKEIYANWDGTAGSKISPSLGDATDTEHGFTPWEAFNGDVSGSAEGYASTAYVSKDRPGSIGWFDSQGSQGPTVINSFKIDALQDKLPTVFDLYGYNAETQVWEFVQGYDISATYVDETSHTFEVDTFRAYSGFRLDIFAPSQLDAQTGTIDYPNPQVASEALNPDVVITELTFNVNSSDVLTNSGLDGIDDAETLYRVLDAIYTQTAAATSNTDSLAKVKAIAQGVYTDIANEADFLGVDINGDGDYGDAYEVAVNGVVGDVSTNDGTVDIWLDVSDASVDDVIDLYIDGQLVATSAALDQNAINAGTYHFKDDDGTTTTFDLNTADDSATTSSDITQSDDKVIIQLKVTNSSSTEVQSLTDTTWEYQW